MHVFVGGFLCVEVRERKYRTFPRFVNARMENLLNQNNQSCFSNKVASSQVSTFL